MESKAEAPLYVLRIDRPGSLFSQGLGQTGATDHCLNDGKLNAPSLWKLCSEPNRILSRNSSNKKSTECIYLIKKKLYPNESDNFRLTSPLLFKIVQRFTIRFTRTT